MTEELVAWLANDSTEHWFARLAELDSVERSVPLLRKDLSAERVAALVDQHQLRQRAAVKFSRAAKMLFTRIGLQQASDEALGFYKSEQMFGCGADFCCGIGGDLIQFANRTSTHQARTLSAADVQTVGVDRDPTMIAIARHNLAVYDRSAELMVGEVDQSLVGKHKTWHMDPDRRAGSGRTVQLSHYSPNPELLVDANTRACIKMAPATVVPESFAKLASLEWVETRGECRQQLAWFGKHFDGGRAAAMLDDEGHAVCTIEGTGHESVDVSDIGSHLYEPCAAVRAAHLVDRAADQFGLQRVSISSAYLTGEFIHRRKWMFQFLPCFRVIDVLPMREKTVGRYLKQHRIGRVEVKKHGVDCDPARLQKSWKNEGSDSATVIITPTVQQKVVAIVAERLRHD